MTAAGGPVPPSPGGAAGPSGPAGAGAPRAAGRTHGKGPHCRVYPGKRSYTSMGAASWAADALRRRATDGHLVNVFECGTHLHVGHHTPDVPAAVARPAPVPLTHGLAVPVDVLARLGFADAPGDRGVR